MSQLDILVDRLQQRIEHRVLGRRPHQLQLATIRLHVTLPAPGGGVTRVTVDAAGIDADGDVARIRCASELAERMVGISPAVLAERSADTMQPGAVTVPWQHLTPFASEYLAGLTQGCDGRTMRWFPGTGLLSARTYAVPASKVMPGWAILAGDQSDDGECDSSGLAARAADNWNGCRRHALHEVLERDAMMLAWRLPTWPRADVDTAHIGDLVAGFAHDAGLGLWLCDVGDPHLTPVVLCLVSESAGGLVCGSASADSVGEAAQRASLEAMMMWCGVRARTADPPVVTRVQTSYDHVGWAWQHGPAVKSWFQGLPRRPPTEAPGGLTALAERCRQQFFGAEPVVVDLAGGVCDGGRTSATRYVCRVIQPYAQRKEWCAERPFVGGVRFRAVSGGPVKVNLQPHPFG